MRLWRSSTIKPIKKHLPQARRAVSVSANKIGVVVSKVWGSLTHDGESIQSTITKLFTQYDAAPRAREHVLRALRVLCHRHKLISSALELCVRGQHAESEIITVAARLLSGSLDEKQASEQMPAVRWDKFLRTEAHLRAAQEEALKSCWPLPLAEALLKEYGETAYALDTALAGDPTLSLRCNTLKCTRQELLDSLHKQKIEALPSSVAPQGLVLTKYADVFDLKEFKEGKFELQDEASQLVAELMGSDKGTVVDYCAGAGGKTLAMSALMGNRGQVFACDTAQWRLTNLARRAKRAGVVNIQYVVLPKQEGAIASELARIKGKASRVLVDAPCSGTGALRRKPDIRLNLNGEELTRLPQQQFQILKAASKLCAPGGRLVYATCSVFHAENEAVVERFLAEGGFVLEPVKDVLTATCAAKTISPDGLYLKCLPNIHGTDGFFAAVLRRPQA